MSDIRRLIDSDSPNDWNLAVRQPELNGEDIDYLLGKMFAEARNNSWHGITATPERVGMRRPKVLPSCSALFHHPAFTPEHLHQMISIRHDKRPGEYGNGEKTTEATYRSPVMGFFESQGLPENEKFDEHAIHLMLDEHQDWFTGPHEVRQLVEHKNFKPSHMGRLLDLVNQRSGLGDAARRHPLDSSLSAGAPVSYGFGEIPYLKPFFDRNPDLPASYLDDWLDFALKNQHVIGTSHLVEQLAYHKSLTDAQFQKLITSDHPRRDALKNRQMSDSQLRAFLNDPRFQDATERSDWGKYRAQSEAIDNQEKLSPEIAELASRHPMRMVRTAVARHPSTPQHVLARLLEHEVGIEKHIISNPSTTPEMLHEVAKKFLRQLDELPVDFQMGTLNSLIDNPKTPSGAISMLIDPEGKLYGQKHKMLWDSVRQRVVKEAASLTPEQQLELATDRSHLVAKPLVMRDDVTPEALRVVFSTPRKGLNRVVPRDEILRRHPEVLTSQQLMDWFNEESAAGELVSYDRDALRAGISHRNMPPHVVDRLLTDENFDLRLMAAHSPHVKGEKLFETIHDPLHDDNEWADVLSANPNVDADLITSVALSHHNPVVRGAALRHPLATPELMRHVPYKDEPFEVIDGILKNPNAPGDLIDKIALDPATGSARYEALAHHAISDDALQKLISGPEAEFDPTLAMEANKHFIRRHPDMQFDPTMRARVRFGVGKLRRIRDLIWEHDPVKGEAPPNKLPPGDWSAGRVASGNISAKKLQQVIDSVPELHFNISETKWDGAQRHNAEPSNVTQINLTDDHVRKMKQAGVYNTFLSMMEVSEQSSHPVQPGATLGWVRWTGTPMLPVIAKTPAPAGDWAQKHQAKAGIHVDEIQSDFGQNWIKMARAQAEEAGEDADEAERQAAAKWPEDHQKAISGILFGGRHPNEVIGEAFMEHCRSQGWHETPIHIHDVSTKAPLSGMEETKKLPGHMQFTYRDLPKKLGMKADKYGKLPTQSNPTLKDKATWSDKIRKMESWLVERGELGDPLAQLGLSGAVERQLVALQGAGQSRPDPAMLREALVRLEDIPAAVVSVTGVDPKLLANISSLTKAEPEPTPERPPGHIAPLTRSAEEVAAAVKRAFHMGRVQGVYLGGKHSAGSMLATDPKEHTVWYLKPGSGGQSPAAGVQEEIASQARREAGFWHIAATWGLENYLPRAEVIVMDGHDWAALRFLDRGWKNFDDVNRQHPALAAMALERLRRAGILHRWAVLDWVCGNTDRHGGNLMLGPAGGVKLIDHGGAFAGPSFNPGRDPKSFVPFYLRYRIARWSQVPPEEKLASMAQLGAAQDDELRRWVQNLDVDRVIAICRKDGLNHEPPAARLRQIQHLAATVPGGQLHAAINRLWAGV